MRQRCIALIILVAACVAAASAAEPSAQGVDEYQVKAAFLYNFARFVEWPEEAFPRADSPLRVCVLGRHQFGRHLEILEGRSIRGRQVVVVESGSSRILAKSCHVLFVSRSGNEGADVLSEYSSLPILTVTECEDGEPEQGIINLTKAWSESSGAADGRFRIVFEIDAAAAETARLELGSRLLELATVRNGKR